jgi:hypothetical protein
VWYRLICGGEHLFSFWFVCGKSVPFLLFFVVFFCQFFLLFLFPLPFKPSPTNTSVRATIIKYSTVKRQKRMLDFLIVTMEGREVGKENRIVRLDILVE